MTAPGAVLSRREGRLQVLLEGRRLADVGTVGLEGVVLWGANATVPALRLLLRREIPLVFLDARGRYQGRLEPCWTGHVYLRDRQREAFQRERLALSRAIVMAKLRGQARVLERWARRGCTGLRDAVARLRSAAEMAGCAPGPGELRGIEGSAARGYFAAIGLAVPGGFRRSRRPPKDVLNAALSLGYAVMFERSLAAASAVGFDPLVGFFHGRRWGRPALALDLLEPFRPAVDRIVFGAARRGELTADLVQVRADGGCYLTDEGLARVITRVTRGLTRKVLYLGHEQALGTAPFEQARSLARAVMSADPFVPFQLPRE